MDYYADAIPEPTTILGVRLRPLSLGHVLLLHRVRSSFVTPDEPLTIHDLALSVLICSLSHRDGLSIFDHKHLDRLFARWHWKLTRPRWIVVGKRRTVDYVAKSAEFAEYIKRHSDIPRYSYNPADFRDSGGPGVQIVKCTLMRDLHIPEAELMDRPWKLCLWDFVTLKVLAGHIRFVDDVALENAMAVADRLADKLKEAK
mgnify:CR=1 FL=1